MKTRIISGIVLGVIVGAVLFAGTLWNPIIFTLFIAAIAAAGTYEFVHNACGIGNRVCVAGAVIYSAIEVISLDKNVLDSAFSVTKWSGYSATVYYERFNSLWTSLPTIIYFVFCVFMILKNHEEFSLAKIVSLSAFPFFICKAFSFLNSIIQAQNGIYYLLLLLNFSSVCDMGAYFAGVTLGKHKLCPKISPKKTVEGAVGGIVTSVLISVLLIFCFGHTDKIFATLLLTVPMCIIGMCGDLFASAVKRSVDLKDYSNLIPGHGGILDRFDSILLLAPVVYMFVLYGVI